MDGIVYFNDNSFVAKKSEYTKEEFVKELNDENYSLKLFKVEEVEEAIVRFYPNGTESSEFEFGKGESVYEFVDRKKQGAFEVWHAPVLNRPRTKT